MYKILNELFGWDYIHWHNTASQGISRVRVAADGTIYYWRYKSIKVLDKICAANAVVWLTCKPEKYIK
jgi:hypothetical protein